MIKKIHKIQGESKEEMNEVEAELISALKENQLLKEMSNLKGDEHYRKQIQKHLQSISDSLERLTL